MIRLVVQRLAAIAALMVLVFGARVSFAQMMPGGIGDEPAPPSKPSAPNPKEPVTHAASGASDESTRLGGTEPSLPANPLEMSDDVRKHIGSNAERDVEIGRGRETHRLIIPPYYSEQTGDYSFRTLFPVWAERKEPNDRASLFGLLYYNRRSVKHDADVLFPVFWNLRDEESRTTVVGPFLHHEAPKEHDNWLAPLFFSGSSEKSGYLHIPPLLTFTHHSEKGGFNLVALYYCAWSGGPSCNSSTADDLDYGVPPLFFAGKNDRSRYELFPPLLHYFHYSEVDDSGINVWGPLVWKHDRESDAFNVFPFFWHSWGKNEEHFTLFPFFHYGYEGTKMLLVNPLFLSARSERGDSTFVTWGYARYRGRTSLDMITPFYWHFEDPDVGLSRSMLFPFYYSSSSPRGHDTMLFPFYLHEKREGLSETTWVTPLFEHSHDASGWSTNIFPIVYLGRSYQNTHTVVAPLFFDFASPDSRTTVGFPVYWRFADKTSITEVVGNTYYHERKVGSVVTDWELHVFPAFSYGETPDGHWWNVLYGLAGYTRRGTFTSMRAMWVPITLSE
jgi:hypothetical protein